MARRILAVLSAFLCLGAIAALASRPSDAAVDSGKKVATVFTRKVDAQDLFDLYTYPARVVPKVNTAILSEADGIVTKVVTSLGHRVSRHQKILVIQHTDPVYRYAPVAVTSPVDGVVSSVEVSEGTQVTRGQKLALVTDPAKIKVELEVPALDLSRLPVGIEGDLRITGATEPVRVRVAGISPFVEPTTGTATAELEVSSPQGPALSPGIVGQVSFRTNSRKGISIPDHAIIYKGKDTLVRLFEDGKSRAVVVKIGKKQRGMVEILDGLRSGAVIIERASRYIGDGEAVKVETGSGA